MNQEAFETMVLGSLFLGKFHLGKASNLGAENLPDLEKTMCAPTCSAPTCSGPPAVENAFVAVVTKKIRAMKKKLLKISAIAQKEGALNDDQQELLASRPFLEHTLADMESLKTQSLSAFIFPLVRIVKNP